MCSRQRRLAALRLTAYAPGKAGSEATIRVSGGVRANGGTMVDKTHSDGSRWLSSNCYDMTPAPNPLSLVPKPNEAPAPAQSRPKPMARLFEILGRKPKPAAVSPRRVGEK